MRGERAASRRRFLGLAFAVAWLPLAGCGGAGPHGGTLYPVTGKILLADGRPLNGGSVQFIPSRGGPNATGKVAADGTFTLVTQPDREGAAPGEYKVRVEPPPELLAKKAGGGKRIPFAARYRDYDGDTGLTATIQAGTNTLEPFRLDAR